MITICPAGPADAEALAALAGEMALFYGTPPEPPDVRVSQITGALFADSPAACCLLAWDDGRLAGFAAYSFLWPAVGLTRSLYLKELYIARTARHAGTGRLLMQRLQEIAVRDGCSRVEWTTDRDNDDAQRFYARLGVPVRESKLFYRVEGEDLRRRAASG